MVQKQQDNHVQNNETGCLPQAMHSTACPQKPQTVAGSTALQTETGAGARSLDAESHRRRMRSPLQRSFPPDSRPTKPSSTVQQLPELCHC